MKTEIENIFSAGQNYYLQGNVKKTIECFKKVLDLNPKHTHAAIALSIVYNDIGRYEEAKNIYKIAHQSLQFKHLGVDSNLDKKFALKHIEVGDMYFKFHRYDEALEEYLKAVKLSPRFLEVRIKIAQIYSKKGFTRRSIQELKQLCNEQPSFIQARIHLGRMYYSQGNIIDAQLEWEKAQKLDPSNQEISNYITLTKQAYETSL